MPFLEDENRPIDLSRRIDMPKGFAITPGANDLEDNGSTKPAWNWGAAFRRNNEMAALAASESAVVGNEPEPGFNPWDKIKGTPDERNFSALSEARNPRKFEAIKADIAREEADKKLLDAQPWWMGLVTEGTAGILSPTTLAPGGTFIKGAKGGIEALRAGGRVAVANAVGTAVQESALQSVERTRTAGESGAAIGASLFLGGLLGAGGQALLSKVDWQRGVNALERELEGRPAATVTPEQVLEAANENSRLRSVGAAAVAPEELGDNTIAGRAAQVTAAATANMNPLLRALHSPSAAHRQIMLDTVENSLYLKKNFDDVASQPAVETLMKEYNGGLAKAIQATNDAYLEHRKAGGGLGRDEFREAVGKAMRRGDEDADPAVQKVAREWRAKVFDPLKKQAIDAGLLPKDVSVETAQSYFSRMWNARKIAADEAGFKGMVIEDLTNKLPKMIAIFDRETAERGSKLSGDKLVEYQTERRIERADRFETRDGIIETANEIFDNLTGRKPSIRPGLVEIKARGPLKERTWDIQDLFRASNGRAVEDYLEHDAEVVGRRYTRIMGADVELARKFGSVDMADQIMKIRDDYRALREGITDEKQLKALGDREKSDIADLEAVRDMLRGTNPGSPSETNYARIVRSVNHFNYLRQMGEVALASLTETVRPAMVHGLMPYMSTLGQTLTNMKGIKASVKEAQLAGVVTERVLGTRLATLSEIIDPYASRGPVESFLEHMTNVASKWNGIRLLTDMQKSIASVMTQNRLLTNVSGSYKELAPKERAYLAYLGIDQGMAERIAKQFAEHGETVDKVRVANQEKWTDEVAARTYRAAISKDVDSIITTKGVADTPLFANTPTGRAMLQFKSFALASHQRVLLRGLQEGQARFVGGLIAMTTIGMMATWLKAMSGNRSEKLQDAGKNPGWWIAEGLDKAGIFAIPMEMANTFEKASGFNPIKSPIKAFDEGSAISQKNQNRSKAGSLLGPSFGLADDILTTAGLPKKVVDGEDITQADKNAAERLLPFNSYAGIRQMLRYVVNPQQ